jgi:predicted alpha/beta-fold hydrolase
MYLLALLWKAQEHGFKCGTTLFKGSDELPITSAKLSYSGCWEDVKQTVEYVHDTYCVDQKTGEKKRRLYVYGVSLGANILGLYLVKEADRVSKYVHAALLYGTPWDIGRGSEWFYSNCFGFYTWVIGMNLCWVIRTYQLPHMLKYLTP